MKKSAEDILIHWKHWVKEEYNTSRFTSSDREEILDNLCSELFKYGVDYEEAKYCSQRIVEFLVTREGQKGNGRYKGWKETVTEAYKANLLMYYDGQFEVQNHINVTKQDELKSSDFGNKSYLEFSLIVDQWARDYFGDDWSESITLEAHRADGHLINLFQESVLSD